MAEVGMLTANAPDPDQIFDPIDDAEDDSGDPNAPGLGDWLLEQVDKFYGVEFDVGDRDLDAEEIEEIQELFRRLRAGEPVDLAEIQEFYPDLYEYLSQQPDFESYFGDDGGLQQGESTWGDLEDALLEAGYDQEFINELLYDPETGVIFDRTNQNAVTLENILGNLTGENWDVLQLPTEAEYGTFRADMDGDGVYDTVVRCTSGAGSACALEDYQVVYGAEVDMSDPEVQDQIRNAAIYEEAQNTEGWEDLEDWEKNKVLGDSGYTGPFVFGDGSTTPPDEPDPQDSSVIEQIKEEFPTWEDIWNEIKNELPSNPEEIGDFIRGVLEASGIDLPEGAEGIPNILQGGYGVIWDPATGVWTDPGSGNVFIPGIPVGLPPSSTIIGTIEDLVTDPIGTITEKVESVLGDIVSDPGGFVEGILSGALEVPNELWEMILGGVAIGQELLDWLVDSGVELIEQDDSTTPLGGEEPEPEVPEEAAAFDRVEETADLLGELTSIFGSTIPDADQEPEPEVEEGFDRTEQVSGLLPQIIGAVGGSQEQEEEQEDPLSGTEDQQEDGFTFGGGSFVENDAPTDQEIQDVLSGVDIGVIGDDDEEGEEDPILDEPVPEEEEEVLSGGASSGGGGGGGGARAPSYDFMARLNYQLPQIAPIIGSSVPTMKSGMFSQRKAKQKGSGLQLGNITESLFGRYI